VLALRRVGEVRALTEALTEALLRALEGMSGSVFHVA
jgi:hypothetical protein